MLHRAPLDYPRAAMLKGIEGNVLLEVNVDEEGLVTDARVLSGPQELRNAALRNVLDWHFSKQMHLPAVTQVTVEFQLPKGQTGRHAGGGHKHPETGGAADQHQRSDRACAGCPAARLPIREGDEINSDLYARLAAEVHTFDEHLHVILIRQVNGTVTLDIAPGPALPNSMGLRAVRPVSTPIRVGGNAQQSKLIRQVRPVYPPEAKAAGIQGLVRMNAVIAREGEVKSLELLSGAAELAPAAMDAVRQWVYEPTRLNGEPVDVITQIDVNFTLAK